MQVSQKAENYIAQRLRQSGWKILYQNYRRRGFEVDIIAEKDSLLVGFEVKFRKDIAGFSSDLWNKKKCDRITLGLHQFVAEKQLNPNSMRIDLVLVTKKRNHKDSFIVAEYWPSLQET